MRQVFVFLTNRWFVLFLLVSALVAVLIGCGGGGGASGPAAAATGRVILPAGYSFKLAGMVVHSGVDTAPVRPDGTFSIRVLQSGPALSTVEDAQGNVLLMGFVDSASSGSPYAGGKGEISAQQTAVALLFVGIGAWDVDSNSWQSLRDLIAEAPQTSQLATTIAARMLADPLAVGDGDDAITTAAQTAATAIGPPANRSQSKARATTTGVPAQRAQLPSVDVVRTRASTFVASVNPSITQSGVDVVAAQDGLGINFVNHYRRRCTAFIYEESAVDANGNSVLPAGFTPKVLTFTRQTILSTLLTQLDTSHSNPQNNYELNTSNALHGVVGSLVDLGTGQGAFIAGMTGEANLPGEPGAVKTTYKVVVVGPALSQHDNVTASQLATNAPYSAFADNWQQAVTTLSWEEFILDLVKPLFSNIVFGDNHPLNATDTSAANLAALQQFVGFLASEPNLAASVRNGDMAGFWKTLLQTAADSAAVRKALAQYLLSQVVSTSASGTLLNQVEDRILKFCELHGTTAGGLNKITNWANLALYGIDATAILHDSVAAFPVASWDVTVTTKPVTLTPQTATVSTNPVTLTATPGSQGDPAAPYVYHWHVSGTANGGLEDTTHRSGHDTDFDSPDAQADYVPNPATLSGAQDTVTVEVYQNAGSATALKRGGLLGQAQSLLTIHLSPCGGPLPQGADSGCGTVTGVPSSIHPGQLTSLKVHCMTSLVCGTGVKVIIYTLLSTATMDGKPVDPSKPIDIPDGPLNVEEIHDVEVTVSPDAPLQCPTSIPTSTIPEITGGPWVVLQGASWMAEYPFIVN